MSGSLNKAILIGNLGADPEVRYTPDGKAIATFSIATSEKWKDKNTDELKEKTEWHRIVCFGRNAELAGEYLSKGRKVYIEGRIQTRNWDGDDGVKHYITEIVPSAKGGLIFLGGGNNSSGGSKGGQYVPPSDDDDIPF